MVNFITNLFRRDNPKDFDLLRAEAELGIQHVIYDKYLIQSAIERKELLLIEEYLKNAIKVDYEKKYELDKEIALLELYVDSYKNILKDNFYIKSSVYKEQVALFIHPFILFPLIQNAIQFGYNTMEKYPIRVNMRIVGDKIKLEVSNRVNHYISNQEDTLIIKHFKARLKLLYPEMHTLIINSNSNIFKSTLILG